MAEYRVSEGIEAGSAKALAALWSALIETGAIERDGSTVREGFEVEVEDDAVKLTIPNAGSGRVEKEEVIRVARARAEALASLLSKIETEAPYQPTGPHPGYKVDDPTAPETGPHPGN